MPHDVFISHSSKDKAAADGLCAALEQAGVRCWIAPRDVLPGQAFSGQIKRAIDGSHVMVLIFSSNSNDSKEVLREVQLAARARRHIVNFRIEDVLVSDDLDYYLAVPHWLDALTVPLERHYQQLVRSVRALLDLDGESGIETPGSPILEEAAVSAPMMAVFRRRESVRFSPFSVLTVFRRLDLRLLVGGLLLAAAIPVILLIRSTGDHKPAPRQKDVPMADNSPTSRPVSPRAGLGEILGQGEIGKSLEMKLSDNVPITFQYCPPGHFTMGSPKEEEWRMDNGDEDQVPVRITRGFWLARTECTQAQWRAVMRTAPSGFIGDDLPVEQVNWGDVQEFIEQLNQTVRPPAGWMYALPTEAQWEYACRAGMTTAYGFGNSLTSLQANIFPRNHPAGIFKWSSDIGKTSRVGSYASNRWGLYDMHGNVWEWCQDASDNGLKLPGGADPVGKQGVSRVIRGGSWENGDGDSRAACRLRFGPDNRRNNLGFRPALVPSG